MTDKWVNRAGTVLAGGIAGVYFSKAGIWIGFLLFLICLRWLVWKPRDFFGRLRRAEWWLLLAGFGAACLLGMTADKGLSVPVTMDNITVEGILEDWQADSSSARGVLRISNVFGESRYGTEGNYIIAVYSGKEGFADGWSRVTPGDRIRVRVKLEQPKEPGVEGGFHAPVYYAVRGINGILTAKGEAILVRKGDPPLNWLLRDKFHQILMEMRPAEAGLMEAILFGDTWGLDKDLVELFKVTGVLHVFAASGSNIVFVLLLAWGIFFFLPLKLRAAASLGFIWLYASLCGFHPPVLRAAILVSAVLAGRISRQQVSALRWLAFAGVLLFLHNPLYLRDVSFQLSFASSLGIILLTPLLEGKKPFAAMPAGLRTAFCLGLGAQIMAMPILMTVFHRVSLVGLAANLFIGYVLGAVLELGLIGMLLIFLPFLARIFLTAAFWLLELSQKGLVILASLPWADFWVLEPGKAFWLFWYLGIFLLFGDREKAVFIVNVGLRKFKVKNLITQKQAAGILLFVFFLTVIFHGYSGRDIRIVFLDVGQGDCILLQTAEETLLVDSGPQTDSFNAGETIVLPYLLHKGIGKLNMVLFTHPDRDHLGGGEYLLNNIPTEKVGLPQTGGHEAELKWREGIPEPFWRENRISRLGAGDVLRYDSGLVLHFLGPVSGYHNTETESFNDGSLVLLAEYEGFKVLLTGDMAEQEIQDIQARGDDWGADFLKIPHHGSKGSLVPDFYQEISPRGVVISVGKNRYGHPAPEVVEYWEERGIPVYRTDEDGTVTLVLGRRGMTLSTERN
ncbi:DNA internalization-related competence protein ComEC/Rec2 [Syntrophobotulus glycolicus DSM 8271]|uniref:DNA internalization-related competence protein ComEC/Rec2 n=1 Tax=Syntrophobotulus glycolicus (strain DSM 8271 / FlGlyR) TaxID=645991 RepID=F0SVG1_SYNGF|nr:DNA internalization-related competence protein ComEC/Rec2 [Syntrophobotulus glycolicus]ADY56734.1 DNA internalization-related competence protein ComEC/Rec2 [Syntrophobotulus glycolicus DSM 8271]